MDASSRALSGAGWLNYEVEMHRASRSAEVPAVPTQPPESVEVQLSRPVSWPNDSLSNLLQKRRSQRLFDDRRITSDGLFDIVIPAFLTRDGLPAYAVPGAIPSITMIVLVNRLANATGQALPQGVYEILPNSGTLVCLRRVRFEHLAGCVDMSDLAAEPAVVLLLCMHLGKRRHYINAYDLGLFEAGQLLQNLSMTTAHAGVGACILGSVFDEPLWSVIADRQDFISAIERHGVPIVAMALGYPHDNLSGEE